MTDGEQAKDRWVNLVAEELRAGAGAGNGARIGAGAGNGARTGAGAEARAGGGPGAGEKADRADALAQDLVLRVPTSYLERTPPRVAAADVGVLERLDSPGLGGGGASAPEEPMMVITEAVEDAVEPIAFRLRLFGHRAPELSDLLPVFESFGLVVVEAVPHRLAPTSAAGVPVHLDDFGLRLSPEVFDGATHAPRLAVPGYQRLPLQIRPDGGRSLIDAIGAALNGSSESDPLNRLVLSAGLSWSEISVLRAYRHYRRQAGSGWSDEQLVDALVAFAPVTRALINHFHSRFDPSVTNDSELSRAVVLQSLAVVERLDHDQVLRGYLGLIDATVRTSYYQSTDPRERRSITLKLDGAKVPELPAPRLHVETFVYSTTTEGLHLRGGPIARGGIRWSDRTDDLRTEVLALARAQVLKNATIVPTGAKGGFICRALQGNVSASGVRSLRDTVAESYRVFIDGLLSITDNVVEGKIVGPKRVHCWDGDDPYLVVAADRGTAELSDTANELSERRQFWLGDAFASGGSHGYDHKAMGITARGAWVAVRHHFRQLGVDVQNEPIRVVGVGDMSGDVFGNGMLRSNQIKLIAAFDHRDIFIDPDPDPAKSFAERQRLFDDRGTWQDYERQAISAGGGVWPRTTKIIELSEPARAALGIKTASTSPPDIVRAILSAQVDLAWFGGIGTFIKAPGESAADIGDHANDLVRVDADKVRARVVAEGGNLAVTQRARIHYSRRGGRINTDFIDNGAGVATSDREVNLKILLSVALDRGRLRADERDQVLAEAEDEVANAVLSQVAASLLALDRAAPQSAADLDAHDALMERLERSTHLDRGVESLPDAAEMQVRRGAGAGLTRPELAVLLAHAKTELSGALEVSELVDDKELLAVVEGYFPAPIRDRFADLVPQHRLYRQLAATALASEIVDRLGMAWASELADELRTPLDQVAHYYWAARQVLGAEATWALIERSQHLMDASTESALDHATSQAVATLARRYLVRARRSLRRGSMSQPRGLTAVIGAERAAVAAVAPLVAPRAVSEPGGLGRTVDTETLTACGFSALQAADLLRVGPLAEVVGSLADVAAQGLAPAQGLEALARVNHDLGLDQLSAGIAAIGLKSRWERWQRAELIDDLGELKTKAMLLSGLALGPWSWPDSARFKLLCDQVDSADVSTAMAASALALRELAALVGEASGG